MGRIGDLMDSINGILDRDEDRLRRAAQVTAETKEKFWADVRKWEASRKVRDSKPRSRKAGNRDREAIRRMRYEEGLTWREIGQRLGRSEESVRVVYRRDLAKAQAAAK